MKQLNYDTQIDEFLHIFDSQFPLFTTIAVSKLANSDTRGVLDNTAIIRIQHQAHSINSFLLSTFHYSFNK